MKKNNLNAKETLKYSFGVYFLARMLYIYSTNIKKMKTYENIKNSSQVKKNDILVEFYFGSNEIWHAFTVLETTNNGITLNCPSGALIFVSNEDLAKGGEYFKRVK